MAMVQRRHSPRAVPVGQDNNRRIRDANSLIGEAFDDGSGLLDVICVHAGKFPRPAGELTQNGELDGNAKTLAQEIVKFGQYVRRHHQRLI